MRSTHVIELLILSVLTVKFICVAFINSSSFPLLNSTVLHGCTTVVFNRLLVDGHLRGFQAGQL